MQLIGQIGGKTACHAQEGDLLLVAVGSYVKVIDISDPAKPVELSTFNAPMVINEMKIRNRMAYLATGEYGYGSAFVIFDLSDPRSPVKRGVYQVPSGQYKQFGISGSIVFVTEVMDFGSGVFALNVSDPDHPVRIGNIMNLPGYYSRYAVEGSRLYVMSGRVYIFDLAVDPMHPVGVCDAPASYTLNLAVENGMAYFACRTNGVRIMDLNDPANPKVVGSHPAAGDAEDIAVSAGVVYVTQPTSGVLVIDATEPTAPILRTTCTTTAVPKMISVSGSAAAVLNDFGVDILDVADPLAPQATGSYTPPLLRVSTEFNDFHIADNKAYVSTESNGIRVADVSDPTSPGLIASYFVDENGSFANMHPQGGLLFTNGDRSFRIYDMNHLVFHDPIGSCLLPYSILDFKISGPFVYFADWVGGLQIVDCSVTTHPLVRSHLITQFEMPQCVALSGDHVYLAGGLAMNEPWEGRLRIVYVKDIDEPVERGYFNFRTRVMGLEVRDEIAYVSWGDRISILNVHDPYYPEQIGILTIHAPRKIALQGRYLYVLCMNGVTVVDVSDPAHPAVAATFEAPYSATDIAVARELIYVLDRLRGLYILRAPGLPSRVRAENYLLYE
ncbi:hypothetical protein LLG95_02605 [bacterium]|nr:hypothetical protein [bacterium]